jgi:hypothetical protein
MRLQTDSAGKKVNQVNKAADHRRLALTIPGVLAHIPASMCGRVEPGLQ